MRSTPNTHAHHLAPKSTNARMMTILRPMFIIMYEWLCERTESSISLLDIIRIESWGSDTDSAMKEKKIPRKDLIRLRKNGNEHFRNPSPISMWPRPKVAHFRFSSCGVGKGVPENGLYKRRNHQQKLTPLSIQWIVSSIHMSQSI